MPSYLWPTTSPCPVLAGYRLVRFGSCACLSSVYIQNLLATHASTMVGLHSLPSVLNHFMVSLSFYGLPYSGLGLAWQWALLFLQPTIFPTTISCHTTLSFLLRSCFASIWLGLFGPAVYSSPNGSASHWFFYYITGRLLCPICFPLGIPARLLPLGFLNPFLNFALPWAFTEFFGLPRSNYIIPHPWGSWAYHQSLTFFAFITLGLSWPILTFPHHILPMVCFFSISGLL